MSLRVAWISHCPVKGLAVRQLEECELTEAGITGDRTFFLVDETDRLVNSKGLGVLQQILRLHEERRPPLRIGSAEQLAGLLPRQLQSVQGTADRLTAAATIETLHHPADQASQGPARRRVSLG